MSSKTNNTYLVEPVSSELLQFLPTVSEAVEFGNYVANEEPNLRSYLETVFSKNLKKTVFPAVYTAMRNYAISSIASINGVFPAFGNLVNAPNLSKSNLIAHVDLPWGKPMVKTSGPSMPVTTNPNLTSFQAGGFSSIISNMVVDSSKRKATEDNLQDWSDEFQGLFDSMKEIGDVAQDITDDIINLCKMFSNLDMYQGFEPKSWFGNFLKRQIVKQVIKTKEELFEDLTIIFSHYLTRGSKVSTDKIKKRTHASAVEILARLVTKYSIVDTQGEQGNSRAYKPDDVTIPRLVACQPVLVARLMARGDFRALGSIPVGLPRFLCFPSGASLIPNQYEHMWVNFLRWSVNFNDIINANRPLKNRQSMKTIFMYANIARSSQLYSDSQRSNVIATLENEEVVPSRDRSVAVTLSYSEDDRYFLRFLESSDAKRGDAYVEWKRKELKRLSDLDEKQVRTTLPDENGDSVTIRANV